MVVAVDFDDELLRHAGEVSEVWSDRLLTSKFCAGHSMGSQ
jgi:hypothetical protein